MLRVFVAFLLSVGAAQLLLADQWNKKTTLQTKQAILIPGHTLPAGSYVVKLVDSLSNRHIVQFLNEREDYVYATVLAIPNYRLQPTGDTQFSWWETPAGNPPAIRAWFYPGDNFGQEFAYPKGLSAKIAQQTRVSVVTTPAETPKELRSAPVTRVEPSGIEQPIETPREVAAAPAPPEPAPAPAPTPEPAPAALPETGSYYLQVGIAGVALALLGAGLRKLVTR